MFGKLSNMLSRYYVYRTNLAKLQNMDERMLDDLGLTRGELESVLRGNAPVGRADRFGDRSFGSR